MKILVIAEHDNQTLKRATFHTISAATHLGTDIDVLVAGHDCRGVAEVAAQLVGVKSVLMADANVYAHQLAENMAPLIAELGATYSYILAPATTFGKNLLPRAAALLDMSMLSDVTQILSPDTFERPMYAGNVIATIKTHDPIKIMTVRTTAFPECVVQHNAAAAIEEISLQWPNTLSAFCGESLTVSSRPELTSAKTIISGGRGLKSAENFKLLEQLADQLGAAVGASRAAVDAGFAPNDYQVGQTGKIVAPELYIAIGISGAIQHLAGMKDSKVVVAINSDPDAPIFQHADYGLVGDLFKILPALSEALKG